MANLRRINKEIELLSKEFPTSIQNSNIRDLIVVIPGPEDTPYASGLFVFSIILSERFPYDPPEITCLTKIYHPNISIEGGVCLRSLKDGWTPALTIASVISEIRGLFISPNISNPIVAQLANLYTRNIDRYNYFAKEWTEKYAMGEVVDDEEYDEVVDEEDNTE